MNDFDGELRIEQVTVPRLDEIAREHDLTIVAAGRADLCRLFERDAARSVYDAPRRNLAMIIVRGMRMGVDGCPFLPVKFDFLGTDGELFFIPYWHKDHGQTWNMLFEAKPGSRMDRFGEVKSGEEAVAIARQVIRELFPWDAEWVRDMELADPNGWLTGRVTPAVRRPVGTLPSGRIVTALGDTAISFDPIAAQGANTGVKHARHLVAAIIARERRPFDADWMTRTFEGFFADHARDACTFSNLLLEDITPAAQEILIAQYGSDGRASNHGGKQRIADAFFANFNDPRTLTPALTDLPRARRFIAMTAGTPWLWNAARGRAAVARDQVRQKLRASG
jgi:2-polyprenyl-6-methoxyphenol hydroxylase-like FAD-dependent oxidoreductase